jgi:hypothetical protein
MRWGKVSIKIVEGVLCVVLAPSQSIPTPMLVMSGLGFPPLFTPHLTAKFTLFLWIFSVPGQSLKKFP